MRIFGLAALVLATICTPANADDLQKWKAKAARVSIQRDDWGIAHVRGPADADAVFGMIYAQAEDDFPRIEANYLTALGRTAEAEGEAAIWADLRMKLFIDPSDLQARYSQSPAWLKTLMEAWADGLNYYLATHPQVQPKVITHFEPWMALSFTEGSIGGDVERISLKALEAFYGGQVTARAEPLPAPLSPVFEEPRGSNGIAISPRLSRNGHALLLINPHTSFFFRSELQMTSDEGLNAYGAVTWGQFFIYQGFNETAGWMHTSSGVDVVDEFAETIEQKDGRLFYRYGAESRPIEASTVDVAYRRPDGGLGHRSFTVYRTHHGPIVRAENGRWIATALMNRPTEALQQSYLRTKAADLQAFLKVGELKANSSNNTLFADAKGQIAYLHPQFIPRRNDRFDFTNPVDGADPATDWQGLHDFSDTPRVIDPQIGWAFNVNDWPWQAAGAESPKATDFPRYMDSFGPNARTEHAERVLKDAKDVTLPSLISAAYDSYLPAFARLVPGLVAAYDALPAGDGRKARLAAPVAALRGWDYRWGAASAPTSVAVFWGEALWKRAVPGGGRPSLANLEKLNTAPDADKIDALAEAVARLTDDFGGWQTPWGEINRFQRLTGDIVQTFDDAAPSIPVPFTSAQWGSLASFGARRYEGTKRYYGTSGNSFVAAVEFGPRVTARAVSAGGESGDPDSRHFNDQALRYAAGDLRPVYFHADELAGHVERSYRPGE